MKKTLKYLKSLDKDTLFRTIKGMSDGAVTTQVNENSDCSGTPPQGHPTPNGSYSCVDGKWTWIPEIG